MYLLIPLSPVIMIHHPRVAQTRKKEKAKTEKTEKNYIIVKALGLES